MKPAGFTQLITGVLVSLLLIPVSTLSAEEENPATEVATEETTSETAPETAPETKREQTRTNGKTLQKTAEPKGRKGDDVFNPSEEISEDFAVSFPVDI